jgi:hypothetical protein
MSWSAGAWSILCVEGQVQEWLLPMQGWVLDSGVLCQDSGVRLRDFRSIRLGIVATVKGCHFSLFHPRTPPVPASPLGGQWTLAFIVLETGAGILGGTTRPPPMGINPKLGMTGHIYAVLVSYASSLFYLSATLKSELYLLYQYRALGKSAH